MPIYDYKCEKCGETFEAFRPIEAKDSDIKCPKCGTPNPDRVISPFFSHGGSCGLHFSGG